MIKKFLSFVALSATLISPVLADDFVPLQYYETNPLPTTQTLPTFPQKENISANTMGVRGLYGNRTTIDQSIIQAIKKRDFIELELVLSEAGIPFFAITTIIEAIKNRDYQLASLTIEEYVDTFPGLQDLENDDYEWCYRQCERYLDLDPANQGSPFRKCFRQCLGRL